MLNNKYKLAQYRENQIGSEFLSCPSDQLTRVFINGELVSAEDFPESELFISYKVTLPQGWKTEISEQYNSYELSEQELKELNCLESVTQSALPVLTRGGDGAAQTRFYFCFPIDLQLLVRNSAVDWPVIHFEVFSRDSWERIRMHGCGFIKVPKQPGSHSLSTQTWKPEMDHQTKVVQYFLGGIIKPKNLEDISKEEKINELDEPGPINRYNYKGLSSGRINVRLNVATQSKVVKADERILYRNQKLSQDTELKKKQLSQNLPSLVNTGKALGSRFTNTKLQ